MKVNNIELKNYRGFKDCKVNFHPNINVFIGSNAAGKTTLLKAIIKSLYKLTSNFVVSTESTQHLVLSEDDINYDSKFLTIRSTVSGFPGYKKNIDIRAEKGILDSKILKEEEHFATEMRNFRIWLNEKLKTTIPEIPIIKFYPANRGAITYSDRSRKNIFQSSQIETWANIYQDNLSYNSFFQWFFENETDELRLQRDSKDFEVESPKLKGVRLAIHKAFEKLTFGDFTIVSKQIERTGSSKLIPTLVLKNAKTGHEEILNNLSDGQKAIITLIADIAYNLSLSHNFSENSKFLESPGIVIIDEMETHLHPKWQREIVPILTEVFPNIQFFIATHSPQVISAVNSDNVFVCDNFTVEKVNLKTKGEDTNSLLKYIFEATERPKPYIKLIDEFDTLIENKAEIEKLRKVIFEIENLYEEDKSSPISNLIDELNIKLSAYQFDIEYDKN